MIVDPMAPVRSCHSCAYNGVRFRKHLSRLMLFPALCPLQSVSIDILGPLPRTKQEKSFFLVITDRFTEHTQATSVQITTAQNVATAFCKTRIFKYGPSVALLLEN